jgi:Zn ribbon nucleic-acid-binding protein
MDDQFCPQCSCDAASILSFKTDDGRFVAAVQCHVCGYEKPTYEGFEDEQAAREAAKREWFQVL